MQSKRIAVTGGIGSGKSAVCDILRKKNFPVFSCDEISRALWKDSDYHTELAKIFPDCVSDGDIDKGLLAKKVFSDGAALQALNVFSHARIMNRLMDETEEYALSFSEVPLLFEGKYENLFDGVIVVLRSKEARIDSVRVRDGLSDTEIRNRMQAQIDYDKRSFSDCCIVENNGDLDQLENQIEKVLKSLGL